VAVEGFAPRHDEFDAVEMGERGAPATAQVTLAEKLAAARELAEWTCQKARIAKARLEGRPA
jgi:hypothetical protein